MNTRIKFVGSFWDYFIMSLGLLFLSVITFGLAFPYWSYWSIKYFFTKMQVGESRIKYSGSFGEYFIMSLGLGFLSIITFGIALPYWVYWQFKYFFAHLELVDYKNSTIDYSNNNQKAISHLQTIGMQKTEPKKLEANTDDLFD